jgi:hypothetical protein
MRRKNFTGIAFRLVSICMGFAVALTACEVALRIIKPVYLAPGSERHFFCNFDPQLGWIPRANTTAQHLKDGFSAFVHQNQYGLRSSDNDTKKRKSSNRRILVLGDSYVWGYGVNQKEMFTNPETHKSPHDILNFGVSGYGTDQEYLFYLRNGLDFDVDEIVLVFTPYNDVANNLENKQYGYLKPYIKVVEDELVLHQEHIHQSKARSLVNRIRLHSRLVDTLDRVYRTHRYSRKYSNRTKDMSIARKRVFEQERLSIRDEEGLEITVNIILALRKIVEQQGASFSVVFIPYKPHILSQSGKNHPLVQYLSSELEKYNIDYFEPYYLFLDQEQKGEVLYNEFDNHFSASGHSLFAKVFTDPVIRRSIRNYYSQ